MDSSEDISRVKTTDRQGITNNKLRRLLDSTLARANTRQRLVLLLIMLANLLLVAPLLMPLFTEINHDDEAKYIQSGSILLHGEIRDLAWGPLVSVFYAPLHLIFGRSPDWFMLEAWAGRFILYTGLWLSMLYLARQMKVHFSVYVIAGILFVTTPLFQILENQSDALFLCFSILALAQLVIYGQTRQLKNIWLASFLIGLGSLVRVESLLLVVVLAVFALALGWKQYAKIKILAAALLPVSAVLLFFVILNLIVQGTPNLGIGGKAWDSFEMNQPVADGRVETARQETRRLFGTAEENQDSVLRAILRNPPAFLQRVIVNLGTVPGDYLAIFNKTQGSLLFFFSIWGIYFQIKKRRFFLLILLLVWPLHTAINLVFFTRHIIPQSFYLPVIFGAIGIWGLFEPDLKPNERFAIALSTLLFFLIGWLGSKPAFLTGALILAVILTITLLLRPQLQATHNLQLVPLLLVLAAGLLLRAPYPFPNFPELGQSENEQGVHYLERQFQPGTNILVADPLPAIASQMENVPIESIPKQPGSDRDLWAWILAHHVRAVYIDDQALVRQDIVQSLVQGEGIYYQSAFSSSNGNVRVFLVKENPQQ